MTSKEFFKDVFAQAANAEEVSGMFRALMNEMCGAVSLRNEELESGKATKDKKSTGAKTATKTKAQPKAKAVTMKSSAKKAETKKPATKKTASKQSEPDVEAIKIAKRTVSKLKLQYVDYNERSFAIVGDTKPLRKELAELNGKFNGFLTIDGKKTAGWVFAKRNAEPVKKSLYIA